MADADYLINIAAQLTGAETADELDRLTASLTGAGKGSDVYQAAVQRLNSELEAQKGVADGAAAALSAGQDQYRQLEQNAIRAGKALERSQGKGVFDARAAKDAADAQSALDGYTGTLRKLEVDSKKASTEQDRLQKSLKGVNQIGRHQDLELSDEIRKYRALAGAARLLPGPLGRIVGEHFREEGAVLKLGKAFGTTNAAALVYTAGAVATVAILVALTAALAAGYVALARYAVGQADAGRSWQLSRDAFAALGADQEKASKNFDGISEATGQSDEALRGLTTRLTDLADPLKAGVIAARDIPNALKAAALAETALGKGGSAQFLQRIEEGRLSVKAFADFAEKKFGPIVEKQLLSLGEQSKRFSSLWTGLFAGLDIEPVLKGIHRLLDDLEAGAPLARAFNFGLNLLFGDVVAGADDTAVKIEAAALKITIALVQAYLDVKPYFGAFKVGLEVVGVGAAALALVIVGLVVVLGLLAGAALAVLGAIALLGYGIGIGLRAVVDAAVIVYNAVAGQFSEWYDSAKGWGSDLIAGLVAGVTGAAKAAYEAVSNVVGGVIDTAKDVLGIHSPSAVFADIGQNTAEGYQQGVEAGTPAAQGSVAAMTSPADVPASPGGRGGGAAGRALDLAGAVFNFYGVAGAEAARDMFAEALTAVLEGDADRLAGALV